MKYQIVAFDMDGTLVREKSSWHIIHRHFGTEKEAMNNLRKWARGEIDYIEFIRRDVQLWRPLPHISKIEEILSKFSLVPNAAKIVEGIQEVGGEVVIVTGGLDILANQVARELGIKHVLANGLEADERGYLTGEGILRVDPMRKHEALGPLVRSMGFSLKQCIAVGDSKWDASFLEHVGLGVAIGVGTELAKIAAVVIPDLDHLDQILDYL